MSVIGRTERNSRARPGMEPNLKKCQHGEEEWQCLYCRCEALEAAVKTERKTCQKK